MLAYQPFLVTALTMGVIALCIFIASNIILMIPVMATRGMTQLLWFAAGGFVLTVEIVVLVILVILAG